MELLSWSALPSLAGVAALAGEPVRAVEAQAETFPPGVRGVAVVRAGEVVGSGVLVDRDVDGVRYVSLVRVRATDAPTGALLVGALEALARDRGAAHVRVSVIDAPGLAPVLAGEGWRVVDAFLELRRPGPASPVELPDGLDLVALDAVNEAAFLTMRNAAFAGTPGAFPFTAEDWRIAREGLDPALLRVLLRAGEPVGFLHGALRADRGEVEAIGLVPRERRRGLGRCLLRSCEALLAARGATAFGLLVAESNRAAVRLYGSEGYRRVAARETWAR